MIPGNSLFPKPTSPFSSVRYDPTDISWVVCEDGTAIERNFAKLAMLSYIGRSGPRHQKRDPQKEKRDLVRKSQAALDDPGRHEAIKVLFCPSTLDVYLVAQNGALVRAQTSPPDYCHQVSSLEAAIRKQEIK